MSRSSINPLHETTGDPSNLSIELSFQEMKEVSESYGRTGETPIKDNHPINRKEILKQKEIPWRKKVHRFDPVFYKCDKKIAKYESMDLKVWGALLSASHTILSDWDTWNHLTVLTFICFVTMAIVFVSGSYRSSMDDNSVATKIQYLISFVFAGYITIVINRWDRIRNTTLASVWGAIENLNMIAYRSLTPVNEETERLKDLILRLCRLTFQLTFLAVQGDSNLLPLMEKELLTEKERLWLNEAAIGTRPLMVVDWIYKYFDVLKKKGYEFSDPVEWQIHTNIQTLRGGVGATLGAIGAQLPYPYVHIVYWTIQILLLSLAVETGVVLATDVYFKQNGEGNYSPPDDNVTWPENPRIWYCNVFFQITASNIVFALFCEGMLKICDKLANPMSKDDTSFSETVYDTFMYNNCRALRVAFTSFEEVLGEETSMHEPKQE